MLPAFLMGLSGLYFLINIAFMFQVIILLYSLILDLATPIFQGIKNSNPKHLENSDKGMVVSYCFA